MIFGAYGALNEHFNANTTLGGAWVPLLALNGIQAFCNYHGEVADTTFRYLIASYLLACNGPMTTSQMMSEHFSSANYKFVQHKTCKDRENFYSGASANTFLMALQVTHITLLCCSDTNLTIFRLLYSSSPPSTWVPEKIQQALLQT